MVEPKTANWRYPAATAVVRAGALESQAARGCGEALARAVFNGEVRDQVRVARHVRASPLRGSDSGELLRDLLDPLGGRAISA
jgi:hypothetical protein